MVTARAKQLTAAGASQHWLVASGLELLLLSQGVCTRAVKQQALSLVRQEAWEVDEAWKARIEDTGTVLSTATKEKA